MEGLQRVQLLAYADEEDGHAGHRADGDSRPAPGIAIHLGQDQSRKLHSGVKIRRGAHCILTGHGIGYQ